MVTGQVQNKSPSSQLILSISNNFHLRPIKKLNAVQWGGAGQVCEFPIPALIRPI